MALERTMPNGLMVSVPASAVDGEGGEASSDLYFNPDDTYYFGSVGGVVSGAAGRPREIAVSRRIVSDFAHGIGTSPTENNGIVFRNSSAGAGGAAQYSPSIFLAGRDEANAELIFRNEVQPGASAGNLVWSASTGGGAYSAAMTLTSAGALSVPSTIVATSFGAFASVRIPNTNYALGNTDLGTGLGAGFWMYSAAGNASQLINANTALDAVDGVVHASVFDRNAASITNASTVRIHSFGWTNNADTYTELASIRGDGAFHCGTVTASTTMSCTILTAGTRVQTPNASSLIMRQANLSTGLGTTAGLDYAQDNPIAFVQNNASRDAASAVCIASVFDRNAASITNASTVKIHSFGWTNNADTYTELAYVRADGVIGATNAFYTSSVSGFNCANAMIMTLAAFHGVDSTTGEVIKSLTVARPLVLQSFRTDGANNTAIASTLDVDAASITNAATMRVHSFGWTNNADTYTELAAVYADGSFEAGELRAGGDVSGAASHTTFTNATGAAGSNAPTMINLPGTTNGTQDGWIKIYVGTSAAWVPYWLN